MKKSWLIGYIILLFGFGFFVSSSHTTFAQEPQFIETLDYIEESLEEATGGADATQSALASDEARVASLSAEQQEQIDQIRRENVTQPEEPQQRSRVLELFDNRPIADITLLNFMGYSVQYAVVNGVPSNTVVLILLLPMLATLVAFVRHVIGLPTIGLYFPIAISITLVATGLTAGAILTATILLAATTARFLLKRVKIMQLPKLAFSMFIVSLFIFVSLLVTAKAGILVVRQLSIFPVLLLILLSERVIQLQLERSFRETITITVVTFLLGAVGFVILSTEMIRDAILLYPELTLLLIPANILIGRYFGLRLTEYYRFTPTRNASK